MLKQLVQDKLAHILYSNDKYKIILIFLLSILFSLELLSFKKDDILFSKKFILMNDNINYYSKDQIDEIIESIKSKEYKSIVNNSCFPTDNKLYWKHNTNLEIEKVREEIINKKSLKISFENKTEFYKRTNPKISIIITLYNQGYYIKTLYAFIQQQELKDIEIIFVDDASKDNSSIIIKEIMELDQRIIYLKNAINKKQFYSINIGVLISKGEYILSIDPDDLILNIMIKTIIK